ncbi:hypothetical protein D3C81_480910 [compost metagenome]
MGTACARLLLLSRPPSSSRPLSVAKPMGPVGKPMVGSTEPAVASSMTKLWPPPAAPPEPAAEGPAAVASSSVVGSAPAAMACCSSSTEGAAWAVAAARSVMLSGVSALHWVSRPRSRVRPSASSRVTAPARPVSTCSPANRRSPSISTRRAPSGDTAITWPIMLLTIATTLLIGLSGIPVQFGFHAKLALNCRFRWNVSIDI